MFDPVTKRAEREVRQIASSDGARAVRVPRWSPDGKRIAYIKGFDPGQNAVCVVDVASGRETVLARDATDAEAVWQQPWSADSKCIVYAGGKMAPEVGMRWLTSPETVGEADIGEESFIAVVPVDGGARRFIKSKGASLCPSWSPKEDRIAVAWPVIGSYKLSEKRYVACNTMAVWTCDTYGNNRKFLTSNAALSKKEASEYEILFTNAAQERQDDRDGDA
jgi:Tol biopolymer transport system component